MTITDKRLQIERDACAAFIAERDAKRTAGLRDAIERCMRAGLPFETIIAEPVRWDDSDNAISDNGLPTIRRPRRK